MGEHWILRWGKIPQNDRRLMIIDEFSGVPEEEVAKMSDLRSTGIAEVVKIRIERANARTRLIFQSNTREGRPLASYNTGVDAIRTLFLKMEDVRRLDFAIVVASGEVDPKLINVLHKEGRKHVYISELCRQLILWAWSMEPANVTFSEKATQLILDRASELGREYSSKIPIVEPADQRLKIARLAASLAARLFSTKDGVKLLVTEEHVEFVVNWLRTIYNSPHMAYNEFSRVQHDLDRLIEGDERVKVLVALAGLPSYEDLIHLLVGGSYPFRKQELQDQLGYDQEQMKKVMKTMAHHFLIKTTARGYSKTPQFIKLLRELDTPTGHELLLKHAEQNGHAETEPDVSKADF
jgi:hypothetical protein